MNGENVPGNPGQACAVFSDLLSVKSLGVTDEML